MTGASGAGEHGAGEHGAGDSPLPWVLGELREMLAELTRDPWPLGAPAGTPLLREGVGLDSLGGTMLLARVHQRFGVDVADEDLNLDSLATIGTLAAFIADRVAVP